MGITSLEDSHHAVNRTTMANDISFYRSSIGATVLGFHMNSLIGDLDASF